VAKAPFLGKTGTVDVEDAIFAAEVKPHLVHEAVRAEQNAQRAGTAATKSRGLVSGGRQKPWRQKGTGRARQGTIRAAQFTGGGHAFAKVPRTFIQKVNRKAAKAALRASLASHASEGTLAIVSADQFDAPSSDGQTRRPSGVGSMFGTTIGRPSFVRPDAHVMFLTNGVPERYSPVTRSSRKKCPLRLAWASSFRGRPLNSPSISTGVCAASQSCVSWGVT